MTTTNAQTVIVGAGIIGAAIAYYLAKSGDRPVLLDQGRAAEGITGDSFGWFNACNAENREYFDARITAVETGSGTNRCDTVIVAAGHGTGAICRAAGLEIPGRTSEA